MQYNGNEISLKRNIGMAAIIGAQSGSAAKGSANWQRWRSANEPGLSINVMAQLNISMTGAIKRRKRCVYAMSGEYEHGWRLAVWHQYRKPVPNGNGQRK